MAVFRRLARKQVKHLPLERLRLLAAASPNGRLAAAREAARLEIVRRREMAFVQRSTIRHEAAS